MVQASLEEYQGIIHKMTIKAMTVEKAKAKNLI